MRWPLARSRPDASDGAEATELDIRMCFRLLLGRKPNPEEWPGHSAQAGQDLARVVSGYLNSLEFTRRRLTTTPESALPELAEYDGFRIYAQRSDIAIGRAVLSGSYEPEVEAVFRDVLRPGMAAVDIGANIGFFSMLAASLVGKAGAVLAVEPNPDNARLLEASRRLNGFDQVTTAAVAAGRAMGLLLLHTTHSNGTTSEPGADPADLFAARAVPAVPIDALVAGGWPAERRVGLIKVDVEGAEYPALLGASGVIGRDRPRIVSEFSPGAMPGISGIDGPEYLRWLFGQGYQVAVLQPGGAPLEAGQDVQTVMDAFQRRGHDHVDLLATPVGDG